MNNKKLFWTGLVGSVVTLICCTTPILVITVAFLGLGALTGYLDYILIPALILFLVITLLALKKKAAVK
jgi:mercuric ion transport protein